MDLIALKRHTLSDDVREVVRAVRRSGGPAVLVGHSSGGHVVSGAAEAAPDDIACLVCVSGVLLPSDRTAGDIPREPHERPAVPRSAEDDASRRYLAETEEDRRKIIDYFYGRCAPEDAEAAVRRLRPQPLAPLREKLTLTPERFGRVRKVYIECLEDRVIFPSVQRKMQRYWPLDGVWSIRADHSPFLSAPDELARLLEKVPD
jgi:pimeloyl-ACP methyl ester carboxylesterase